MGSIPRPPIFRVSLIQLAVLIPVSVAVWWFDTTIAYSMFIGGLLHLIPNIFFARKAFRFQGASARQMALWSMSLGQALKFLLTLLGFGLVFVLVTPLNVLTLFLSYLLMVIVWLFAAHLTLKA